MKKNYVTLGLFAFFALIQSANAQYCHTPSAHAVIEANNIRAKIHNGGDMFWDLIGIPKFEVPKNSGIHAIFAANLWLGGISGVDSNLKVAAGGYRMNGIDYSPGALKPDGSFDSTLCYALNRTFEVSKAEIDAFKNGGTLTENIRSWPASGNAHLGLPQQELAPFNDVNNDGIYNPSQGDYPLIRGDVAIWYVINDWVNDHTETNGEKIGVEIHVMTYAFDEPGHVENTLFMDYRIINKQQNMKDFLIGLWTDVDLGNPQDDMVGCDTNYNLGIVYNGDAHDEDIGLYKGYGINPPQLGVTAIKLPKLKSNGEEKKMYAFMYHNNNNSPRGDPRIAPDYYNYMRAHWRDSSPMYYGGTGHISSIPPGDTIRTRYMYSSDPADSIGWNECNAGNTPFDRRFMQSYGPFEFAKGDEISFTNAYIWVRDSTTGKGACNTTFNSIRAATDSVRTFLDQQILLNDKPKFIKQNTLFSVYPNPVKSFINVQSSSTQNMQLRVFDLSGKELIRMQSGGTTRVDLSHLHPGMYLLQIEQNNQQEIHKIVVQH